MTNDFIGQGTLVHMLETLKKQMESVEHTQNLYAHNAQLMAIATQSLSIELTICNLMSAGDKGECIFPWSDLNISYWKNCLNQFETDLLWCYDEDFESPIMPSEFDIFSTLIAHHVAKEREDGRDFYNIKEDGLRRDNANALDFTLGQLANMDSSYASEVAEDAIAQLIVTLEELEKTHVLSQQPVYTFVEKRMKLGRKPASCFLPTTPIDELKSAFQRFMASISTGDDKVLLGYLEYDRKYVFVLLYYRFIREGLMNRKLHVSCYSMFISNALKLEHPSSFRKCMNNWMQKIDLYGCTFEELTLDMVRHKRYHEQQLTPNEWEVWQTVNKELEKAIDHSGAFRKIFNCNM
ncbi:MAG: hypothetical protein J6C58_06365 [Bacteroidaceae bacterium]|nr:hypothetical protein [Bacteroidaceae bacterium]